MRGLEYSNHAIKVFFVSMPVVCETVCTGKRVTNFQLKIFSYNRTGHYFEVFRPPVPFFQSCAEKIRVRRICSHNPEVVVTVAQGHGYRFLYQPVLRELLGFIQLDVSRWKVDMKHTAQNELQRTALGPYHKINPTGVSRHLLLELIIEQE